MYLARDGTLTAIFNFQNLHKTLYLDKLRYGDSLPSSKAVITTEKT